MYINDIHIHFVNSFMTSQVMWSVKTEMTIVQQEWTKIKMYWKNPRAFEYNLDSMIIVNKLF